MTKPMPDDFEIIIEAKIDPDTGDEIRIGTYKEFQMGYAVFKEAIDSGSRNTIVPIMDLDIKKALWEKAHKPKTSDDTAPE